MLTPFTSAQQILDENAELRARLQMLESSNTKLREENQSLRQLKEHNEQLSTQVSRYSERVVLLEEEVRWLKAQFFRRSTQQDGTESNPDQRLLFNEAEVLAAIEAADAAHAARTTKIEAHERKHTGGRKAIPEHFPRIRIEHDLSAEQKICTKCATPHPLVRMSQETRECYRYEPPKISVELHIRHTYVCEHRHEEPITASAPPASCRSRWPAPHCWRT